MELKCDFGVDVPKEFMPRDDAERQALNRFMNSIGMEVEFTSLKRQQDLMKLMLYRQAEGMRDMVQTLRRGTEAVAVPVTDRDDRLMLHVLCTRVYYDLNEIMQIMGRSINPADPRFQKRAFCNTAEAFSGFDAPSAAQAQGRQGEERQSEDQATPPKSQTSPENRES